jgi:putative FmdB family regulatory protein
MPLYEYTCNSCKQSFELIRHWSDRDELVNCAKCNSSAVQRRIFSSPRRSESADRGDSREAPVPANLQQNFEAVALALPSHPAGRSWIGHFTSVGMPRGIVAEGGKHQAQRLDIRGANKAIDLKDAEMHIDDLDVE